MEPAEDRLGDRRDALLTTPANRPQWSQPRTGWVTVGGSLGNGRGHLAAMEPAEDRLDDAATDAIDHDCTWVAAMEPAEDRLDDS